MYPFNRTTSIHAETAIADADDEDEEGHRGQVATSKIVDNIDIIRMHDDWDDSIQLPKSPVEKTILASILELSTINDRWVRTLSAKRRERSGSYFECSWRKLFEFTDFEALQKCDYDEYQGVLKISK
ncbi:unnamed protein product [Caenorhabditis bovis]|uniref:Uncharacterized protein n=1 Tax=Caenorhabditis bovis TaxID=2654633 RepID=A0A8S1ECH6_9PELO|nr:unnamed protein product [Caenorhabditis bovis]